MKDIEFKREKFDPLPGKSIERKFMYFFGPYNPKANYKMSLDYNEDEKKVFERKPIEEPDNNTFQIKQDLPPELFVKIA